jgi:acyl-CoA thioesterase
MRTQSGAGNKYALKIQENVMAVLDTSAINAPGFNKYASLMGIRFVEWEPGRCVAELDAGPHLHHPGGIVHGGVAYGLADSAMAHALIAMIDAGMNCSTIEMKMSYLAAVRAGLLRTEANVLKKGRTVAFCEARVECDGRLVATATGSFAIHELR